MSAVRMIMRSVVPDISLLPAYAVVAVMVIVGAGIEVMVTGGGAWSLPKNDGPFSAAGGA